MWGKGPSAAAVMLVFTTVSAHAQTTALPEVARADIAGSVGWLNVNKSEISSFNDWYNRGLQGALTFGWHWSTHLKTEVEASASRRASLYASGEQLINGLRVQVPSEYGFRTRRLTLSHHYQFGENAWFHPHLAAGVDFNWETTSRLDRAGYVYGPRPSFVQPVAHPDRTDLHVRPVCAAGFKAYMTPQAFFRSDLRVVVGQRIEEALLRFGFGVDF